MHQIYSQIPFAGPSSLANANGTASISPQETTLQSQQNQQQQQQLLLHQQQQQGQGPLVATGDWTKDLVHLAKTAELKKYALTLQLHTAHILSAHASLEQKSKAIQDIREQKNNLESERTRLLNSLREINEDRDKADLMEATMNRECAELRVKINQLTEGEYAGAKRDVDRLRQELGQPPLPSLQSTLDEKSSQYLNQRRMDGDGAKRISETSVGEPPSKRPRGRPKGSKNRGGKPAGASSGQNPGGRSG